MEQLFWRRCASIRKGKNGGNDDRLAVGLPWVFLSKNAGALEDMQIFRLGLKAVFALGMIAAVSLSAAAQEAKPVPDFPQLDASTLPISHKIHIGGDPDWLATGFGSVWVAVPKNNELVRVDPRRNVVQARVPVDKEPCYGIG
ncbi:MAG TPA: hypothetical protein VHA06_14725, partial [Candidatus Angelobacter sp.]|nr:hypothetical protein [Candidatus Angelobacter sp.]